MTDSPTVPSAIRSLHEAYRSGRLRPEDVVRATYRAIEAGPAEIWISLVDEESALAEARALDPADLNRLLLFGVPVSVKDNIDVAGLSTTAACPDFAYAPDRSATVIRRLLAAGAIVVGKTNLDQFATGLSGARSPYGVLGSAADPSLVSGGSSSGAALSVALGQVILAIGTDTAGSGRVPAALNGIVGIKPSLGLLSTLGLVPACRSLDCITVFAGDLDSAATATEVMAGYDAADPWSRRYPALQREAVTLAGLRLGIPRAIEDWGDRGEAAAWEQMLAALREAGAVVVPIDPEPWLEAGRLLYNGPWLAERLAGNADFVRASADSLLPVTRGILEAGEKVTGVQTFQGLDRLAGLRRAAEITLAEIDALLTPTVTRTFNRDEMLADPVAHNARLGTFTTFTNLLDLAAVAVPAPETRLASGVPLGVTVQVDRGQDEKAWAIAAALSGLAWPSASTPSEDGHAALRLAVVGAHLAGMPLHGDLIDRGAVFEQLTETAAEYRFYALAGGPPRRPGLQRVGVGGSTIEVEVYRISPAGLGSLMATVPAPLGIGRVRLVDGSESLGFICESVGLEGAEEITGFGGWRNYLAAVAATA